MLIGVIAEELLLAVYADIVESITATDATATGSVVFATLVDDPASVGEIVDAYLGEIMLEVASAAETWTATMPQVFAADVAEAITAVDTVFIFTPANLVGLIGWWDVSVTASLSLTGSTINSIADQSGGGMTLARMSPPTPTRNLPNYNATGLNGRPAMIFNSANQEVIGIGNFPLGGTDMTSFAVVKCLSSAPNNARIFSYAGGLGTGRDWDTIKSYAFQHDTGSQINYVRNSVSFTAAMTLNVPHRVICTTNAAGVKTIYVDGVATTTTGTGGTFGINGWFTLGSTEYTGDAIATWVDAIAEAGVTTSYSDATVAAQIDSYLKTKWGL